MQFPAGTNSWNCIYITIQNYEKLKILINNKNKSKNKDKKILFFIFDDMSYSGNQITEYIHRTFNYVFDTGSITKEAQQLKDNMNLYII